MTNNQKPSTPQKNETHEKVKSYTGITLIDRVIHFIFNENKLTQTRKAIVLNDLVDSSSPGMDFFVMITLSCTIATFGLFTNSTAVIIGAMLVAPLMSPILSLSMASIKGLSRLFRQSVVAVIEGACLAILLSTILAFVAHRLPFGTLAHMSSEVLARSSPNPIDLGIALAGGAAAAYALAHPRLTAALPGVAIATALMPPLCTVGIGIAFGNLSIMSGAFLLFLTNLIAISFAGIVTFAAMGFGPRNMEKNEHVKRSLSISLVLVIAIGLLLAVLAWRTISEARLYNQARDAIMESANQFTTASLVDLNMTSESEGIRKLVVTLRSTRELSHLEVLSLQEDVAAKLNKPVALELISILMQVLNPLNPPTPTATITPTPPISPTATFTPVPSASPTPTLQPTSTPWPAFVIKDTQIYDMPAGEIGLGLPQGSPVWVIMDERLDVDGVFWVKVWDVFQRSGWIGMQLLDIPHPW